MRRILRLAVTMILGTAALVGFAVPLPATAAARMPAIQGIDDFTFDSWHSDYRLGVDAAGRSVLTTTETIVARFPDVDQNRGIRRAIPTRYDGHPTDLRLERVTDENGTPRSYDTEDDDDDSGDFLVVTVAGDDFVHGAQTYVLTYTQHNVILYPDDSAGEEFYWQVNGTGWAQPFGTVSATVHVESAIVPRLSGDVACFTGSADSAQPCDDLSHQPDDDGWRLDAAAAGLAAHEGLTIDVGFVPGTFVPRDDSFTANPFPALGLAGAVAALIAGVVAALVRATRWRSARGRRTIVAEYLPPHGVNLLTAGNVAGPRAQGRSMPALFIDLAVRGNIRVLEAPGKNHFLLGFVHASGVDATERSILAGLFPTMQPGARRDLKGKDAALAKGLHADARSAGRRVYADGLREHRSGTAKAGLIVAGGLTGALGIVGSILALATEVGGVWPVLTLILAVIATAVTLVLVITVRPLTAAGAELRDYLKGMRLYIELAETDRMRVLQSPQGALRSPYRPDASSARLTVLVSDDDPNRPLQVLKLYERVLPYAVLFGQEKQWANVLGEYYARTGSQPDWYYGSSGFNAAYFAAGVSAFTSTTSTAWSGSAGGSSSSGFGGGGSVGGGGGGGGGGGT
jgi:uncharacterized membrane protein YgcG